LRERLSALSRGELIGLVAIVAVTLGGAGLWYLRSLPQPVQVSTAAPGTGPGAVAPSPTATPVPLVVDVAGAVHKPGVYEFSEGDRIVDAIQAAGGATSKADLEALNLAAPVQDGVQLLGPTQAPASGTAPASPGAPGAPAAAIVNINSASATELEALPGIGEVISQAIVDYRTQNGPFASVDDLESVSGIGPSILEDVRDLVTV
jgi:competence protein ComEA